MGEASANVLECKQKLVELFRKGRFKQLKEYFAQSAAWLCSLKDKSSVNKSGQKRLSNCNAGAGLLLLFSVIFRAQVSEPQRKRALSQEDARQSLPSLPTYLLLVLQSDSLVQRLLAAHTGIQLSEAFIEEARIRTKALRVLKEKEEQKAEAAATLLEALLIWELEVHDLAEQEPAFIRRLCTVACRPRLMALLQLNKPSPIGMCIYESVCAASPSKEEDRTKLDVYKFLLLQDKPFEEAWAAAPKLNHRRIFNNLLESQFSRFATAILFFYRTFPEYAVAECVVSEKRDEYLRDWKSIPVDKGLLITYIGLVNENEQLDAQTYHATKLVAAGEWQLVRTAVSLWLKACTPTLTLRLLNNLISLVSNIKLSEVPDSGSSFLGLLDFKRKPLCFCRRLVKHAPVICESFNEILQEAKNTRQALYFHLVVAILEATPSQERVDAVRKHILYFSDEIIEPVSFLLKS